MKKLVIGVAVLMCVFSCGKSDKEKAQDLVTEARTLAANKEYGKALERIDSLRKAYPRELEVRRVALDVADSIKLEDDRSLLAAMDSSLTFARFELEDMKSLFTFEKDEKYQSVGNYVDKMYAGDKSRLTFFIQVNEEGTMQLVTIDKERKYHFQECAVTKTGSNAVLPESATSKDFDALNRSYALALAIQQNRTLVESRKKIDTEIRFIEKRIVSRR